MMSEHSKYDEMVSKLTQEIARKGEQVPERYMLKEDVVIPPAIDVSPIFWEETSVIDLSLLSNSQKELRKLHYALNHWGCFQVINHGMSSLVEDVLDVTKQFFALPLKEKLKCSKPGRYVGGYGNTISVSNDKTENWNDKLFLSFYPKEQRDFEIWPQKPDTFRKIIQDYASRIMIVGEDILKALAQCLELKEDSFLKKQAENQSVNAKFTYYPPCSRPDRVLGAQPHSDPVTLTILLPDDKVQGLDILKDEQWYKVPVKTGALFVNLGDVGEVMSNGIFKSVVHRVVANTEKERVSIAAFFMPGPMGEIGPIDELITNTQSQVYKKVDLTTYRKIIFENLGSDTKVLDSLKL